MDIRPDAIRTSLNATLRRLRRDALDVLLLHDASLESLSAENSAVLESLVRKGLICSWGVSTWDASVARRAVELDGLTALQVPVYPAWVAAAGDLFARCRERRVCVIAHQVASGLREGADARDAATAGGNRLIEQCFTFALRQPAVHIVLRSTTNPEHLRANVQAMRKIVSDGGCLKALLP